MAAPSQSMPAPHTTVPFTTQSGTTATHTQGSFTILVRKAPISRSAAIDAMSQRLGGIPVPEMIFGDNLVRITHNPTQWTLDFAAEPALDLVDKTGEDMLSVSYAGSWSSSRQESAATRGIREVVRPYDWSYSSTYCGDERVGGRSRSNGVETNCHDDDEEMKDEDQDETRTSETSKQTNETSHHPSLRPTTTHEIPLELLKRRDPILFFDEAILYESELDDNGISALSVKVRVMQQRMLLLCRLYMRLDDVLVRVRDTRVYVDFATDEVLREYTAKEDSYANVRRGLQMSGLTPDGITVALRDANQVSPLLPVVEHRMESVSLRPR